MNNLEELIAWQKAREVRRKISAFIKTLPIDEKFKLSDQLTRSSRSVTAAIAEGFGRYHFKENIQYCRIARGSLIESLDHLYCALDEGYIDKEKFEEYKNDINENVRIINGCIKYLKNAKPENRYPRITSQTKN